MDCYRFRLSTVCDSSLTIRKEGKRAATDLEHTHKVAPTQLSPFGQLFTNGYK